MYLPADRMKAQKCQ